MDPIDDLLAEHARCWRAVGWAEGGTMYDPGLKYKIEEAREATEALKAAMQPETVKASPDGT